MKAPSLAPNIEQVATSLVKFLDISIGSSGIHFPLLLDDLKQDILNIPSHVASITTQDGGEGEEGVVVKAEGTQLC